MDQICPECGSGDLHFRINKNRAVENITPIHLRIPGHCADCGYSFTAVFKLQLIEFTDRR